MISFFCALAHDQSSNLIKYIDSYIKDVSASYLITLETSEDSHIETQGQHFHICIQSSTFNYDTFRNSILVNKFKLSGRAVKNSHGRQYGKIHNLRDETKLMQYCCKEKNIKNIIYKNIDLKTIQELIEKSYPKKKQNVSIYEELMKHLAKVPTHNYSVEYYCYFGALEDATIDYYIDNNVGKSLSKNHMKSLITSFLMYHSKTKRHLIKQFIKN